jgi:hypothetical protein
MYFLFAGENYYPTGGMDDLVGTFATIEDARKAAEYPTVAGHRYVPRYDWYHIATVIDGKLVVVA